MYDFIKLIISRKMAMIVALFVALGGLALSLSLQSFGNFEPCKLCIAQRCLLGGAAICLSLGLLMQKGRKVNNLFFWGAFLFLLGAFFTSAYQLLIQFDIIPEPAFCHRSDISTKSVEEILEQINNTYNNSCKSLGPTIFGIPLSGFGCAGTFFCSVYLALTAKN